MRVRLRHQTVPPFTFEFDRESGDLQWRQQNPSARFLVNLDVGAPTTIFVKQWVGRKADGHALMLEAIKDPIPNTPLVLAAERDGGDAFYFMENLPNSYRLLNEFLVGVSVANRRGDPIGHLTNILNPNTVSELLKQLSITMGAISDRGYVFVDLCTKNILFERFRSFRFVDIDSCVRVERVAKLDASQFDPTYWTLWHELVGRSGNVDDRLPKTLFLSFGAVWARALALSLRERGLVEATGVLTDNRVTLVAQRAVWASLAFKDSAAFDQLFPCGPNGRFFTVWKNLVEGMTEGENPPWRDVTAAVRGLISSLTVAALEAPQAPSDLNGEPKEDEDRAGRLRAVSTGANSQASSPNSEIEQRIRLSLSPAQSVTGGRFKVNLVPSASGHQDADEGAKWVVVPPCAAEGMAIRAEDGSCAVIAIRETIDFKISGNELYSARSIPSLVAEKGGTVQVLTPGGYIPVSIAPKTVSGTFANLVGHGLPQSGGGRGSLRVRIDVEPPIRRTSNILSDQSDRQAESALYAKSGRGHDEKSAVERALKIFMLLVFGVIAFSLVVLCVSYI